MSVEAVLEPPLSTAVAEPCFRAEAERAFVEMVLEGGYPCVGARAAVNAGTFHLHAYERLDDPASTKLLADELRQFACSLGDDSSEYETFVAVFRTSSLDDELEFERRLWSQLRRLNEIDATGFAWDPHVSSDPADVQFSFSFAGRAFYVIGIHAQSSREARRFRWPTLVFNPHEQFERLRTDGKWKRMQETIRARDLELQGSINPMLSDFGEQSEARQYSGRAVDEDWRAPFKAAQTGKCPFHH